MKKIIALLIISISLIGCSGNGVSSPEYTEPTYNTPTYVEPEEKTDSTIIYDTDQPDCAIYADWMPCSPIDTIY